IRDRNVTGLQTCALPISLRYYQRERRCEQMSGGVPPWTWPELGAQVTDLDALYVNFISGYEMNLETAQLLRRGFPRFLYADLHKIGRASCRERVEVSCVE